MYARSILYIGKEFMIIIIVVEVEEKSSNVLVDFGILDREKKKSGQCTCSYAPLLILNFDTIMERMLMILKLR
jgi:hypothetical protein